MTLLSWCFFASLSVVLEASMIQLDAASMARHEALAGFEKFALELAQAPHHETGLGDDETNAIDTILEFVESMWEQLKVGHTEDLALVNECNSQLDWCKEQYDENTDRNPPSDVDYTRSLHDDCRVVEGEFNYTVQVLCGIYHTYRLKNESAKTPECNVTHKFNSSFMETTDPGSKELVEFEECLVESKEWIDPLFDRMVLCREAEEVWREHRETCKVDQNRFEDYSCRFIVTHDDNCKTYEKCWETQSGLCNSSCDAVAVSVAARKADNETAQRVSCLLKVLKDENKDKKDALAQCKSATFNVSYWDIECPNRTEWPEDPYPVDPPCGTTLTRPCEDDWVYKEYTTASWHANLTYQATAHECVSSCAMRPHTNWPHCAAVNIITELCNACHEGFKLNASQQCEHAVCTQQDCGICDKDDVCTQCSAGFSLSADKKCNPDPTTPPIDPIPHCDTYESGECTGCFKGYTLDEKALECKAFNCTEYTDENNGDFSCKTCDDGYLPGDDGICKAGNCTTYNSTTAYFACQTCDDSFMPLENGTCLRCTPHGGIECKTCHWDTGHEDTSCDTCFVNYTEHRGICLLSA